MIEGALGGRLEDVEYLDMVRWVAHSPSKGLYIYIYRYHMIPWRLGSRTRPLIPITVGHQIREGVDFVREALRLARSEVPKPPKALPGPVPPFPAALAESADSTEPVPARRRWRCLGQFSDDLGTGNALGRRFFSIF